MEASDNNPISLARQATAQGQLKLAFEMLMMILKEAVGTSPVPPFVEQLEEETREVLLRLNAELSVCDRVEDILANFEKIIFIYPRNAQLLNDLGKYLLQYGYYMDAMHQFEQVLLLEHACINAEKNLNSAKNMLVERWHYRMLNDKIRNESYRQAIRDLANRDTATRMGKVLDVGTGTGLLAIYAQESGFRSKIIACDGSEVMIYLAQLIQTKNGIPGIEFINKMSTDLTPEEIGGKANVLLTELFDAGLFGEHVLQMLQHAWSSLLAEGAQVIPNRAEFFIAGVQSAHLNMKYQLSGEAKKHLNIIDWNVHISHKDETYDCEDVHLIKDLKYVTSAQSLLKINFNDLKDIEKYMYNTKHNELELQVVSDGILHAYIGWFTLYLSDTVTISTDPRSGSSYNAWQQAVFYNDIPKNVKKQDTFKIKFSVDNEHLTLEPTSNAEIITISSNMIKFLNDVDYMKKICDCIPMACVYLSQIVDISQMNICDLCPFPFFGMMMMKRGAGALTCCAKTEHDINFITQVFNNNKIPLNNVTILEATNLWIEDFKDDKYHAIFSQIIEPGGDIDISMRDITEKLKSDYLYTSGLYLPAAITVYGQLVSSRWLDVNNKLFDQNVDEYDMASEVNHYSVSANYYIDFSTLKYVPLTEPVRVCAYPAARAFEWNTTCVINNGHGNALLCWYEIELMHNTKTVSTRRANSFADGMLFITHNHWVSLTAGHFVRIIQVKDDEGHFKLLFNTWPSSGHVPSLNPERLG